MPQMAPLIWTLLMLFFIFVYLVLSTIIYFKFSFFLEGGDGLDSIKFSFFF